jgi:hypothetical protein
MQSRKYETEVLIGNKDVPVVIEYDYQPPERCTRDYPGCDAEVTIIEITDANGNAVILSESYIAILEEEILEDETQNAIDEREMRADHMYEVAREARLMDDLEVNRG